MKIAYSHLVQYIAECPSIEQVSDSLLQLGHEHEIDGNIFNMEFTPNRGDCLSINGLLRDLAVFYKVDLNRKIFDEKLDELQLDFENLSKSTCPQISFLKLEIDQVPETYKDSLNDYFLDLRLNRNNFFTDVSNYLSYETGQPTHCYDVSKINNKLVFHTLDSDEEFETLLDKKIKLSNNDAVFSLNGSVINLAGIVGGKNTSCSNNTKEVLVECAYFKPDAIIGKSVKYDIQSEAAHKFERGVDPQCQEKVLRRFIEIVSQNSNIKDMSLISYKFEDVDQYQIPVSISIINKIIGSSIKEEEYLNILSKLKFDIIDNFIHVPSFRSDVRTQNDIAEEIARVIGYDNIEVSEINIPCNKNTKHNSIENKLRLFLLDHGFYEIINAPFVSHATKMSLRVDNPLDSNREFLRTNITDSLLENLLYNEKRQKDSVKLFEISDIYLSDDGINKKRKLSIVASGRVGLNFEDFSKKINKNYLETLFRELQPNNSIIFNTIPRDLLDTKLKNEIISMEIDIDNFSSDILAYNVISTPPKIYNQYQPVSDQPSSFKDISYSIKENINKDELQSLLFNYKSNIIKSIYIFDYFYNEKTEEIKIGFRFIFQSKQHTLTSSEIDLVYNDIVNKSLCILGVSIPGR